MQKAPGINRRRFCAAAAVDVAVGPLGFLPAEFYQAPRSWAERAYPKLIHYNKVAKGAHFPAWEQPQLFAQELRVGLRSLRI